MPDLFNTPVNQAHNIPNVKAFISPAGPVSITSGQVIPVITTIV